MTSFCLHNSAEYTHTRQVTPHQKGAFEKMMQK